MALEMLLLWVGGGMRKKSIFAAMFKLLNQLVKQNMDRDSFMILRPRAGETIDAVNLIRLLKRKASQ
jgi:hypothetical protein